jgi:hypothetical protein
MRPFSVLFQNWLLSCFPKPHSNLESPCKHTHTYIYTHTVRWSFGLCVACRKCQWGKRPRPDHLEQIILSALVPTKKGTLVWDTESLDYKVSYITDTEQNFAHRTSIPLALTWLARQEASHQPRAAKGSGKGAAADEAGKGIHSQRNPSCMFWTYNKYIYSMYIYIIHVK